MYTCIIHEAVLHLFVYLVLLRTFLYTACCVYPCVRRCSKIYQYTHEIYALLCLLLYSQNQHG